MMNTNSYNNDSIKRLSEHFKLLSEPNRLKILCSLGLECRPVSDVIEATGLSQTNVSFHLRILREARMVRPERRGSFIYYCLPDPELLRLVEDFRDWLENHDTSQSPETKPAKMNTQK
jgi:ArsR family transcriptional regulator